jgi:hypothetical protein
MDKMLFQFTRIGFCDDIHTKQRRASKRLQPFFSHDFGVFRAMVSQ